MLTFVSIRPFLVLCAFLLCALTLPVRAATLYVSPDGNDNNAGTTAAPYATIQAAVNNATTGDTITLHAGTYAGNGNRDIDFAGKSLTFNSDNGAARTVIDCGGTETELHRAFYFHSKENNAVLDGLTMKNGSDHGTVRIEKDCVVKLNKCAFSGNAQTSVINTGATTLTGCTFTDNHGVSGGIFNEGTASLTGCTFTSNTGSDGQFGGGGGVYNTGKASLFDCTFSKNTSDGVGFGGGIFNAGKASLTGCTLTGNTGTGVGSGGIFNSGTASLSDCILVGNTGGVYSEGTVSLTGCTLTGNSGGGYCSDNSGNSSGGGGIYSRGTATLTGCTLTGNTSNHGGAIWSSRALTLTNCIICRNIASAGNGGGVESRGNATIRFCSISGNVAKSAPTGGAKGQGGAFENDGTATLICNVLWDNTASNAAEIGTSANGNPTTTVTYCDIQGGLSGTGNIKIDPGFIDATNGDLHLQAGSPCRGAGIMVLPAKPDPKQLNRRDYKPDLGVLTDADGQKRPNPPSIGAYEYSANPPKPKKILILDVGITDATGNVAPDTAAPSEPAAPKTPKRPVFTGHPSL